MSLLRVLVFGHVLFSSIPISEQHDGIKSVEELQKTDVFGRYHYTGCFSKGNMEFLKEDNFKGYFYPLIHISSMCFNSCKTYFSQFNDNKLHLIAIQHQLCFCIRLSIPQKQFEFNKTLETKCNLRTAKKPAGYNIGGGFEFALYCERNNSCSSNFYTTVDETATEQRLKPELRFTKKTYFVRNISFNKTKNFTTRFGDKGEFCMNENKLTGQGTADKKMNNHEEMMDFVKRYVPGSYEDESLCLHYCQNKANNENISVSKYAVLSTVSSLKLVVRGSCYYCTEDIGLCHCIDNLNEYKSEKFEKCGNCSKSSKCTSLVKSRLCIAYELKTDAISFMRSSTVETEEDYQVLSSPLSSLQSSSAPFSRLQFSSNTLQSSSSPHQSSLSPPQSTLSPPQSTLSPPQSTLSPPQSFLSPLQSSLSPLQSSSSPLAVDMKCNDTNKLPACPGELKKMECPKLSRGWGYWECSHSKEFETDFTNCTTDKLHEIEQQNSTEMLKNLRTLVSEKGNKGDYATYFGHEIQLISNLVEMAVRNISTNATVQNAVVVIGNLIANKEPWNNLKPPQKSKIATNLTFSIENVLFSFAHENDDKNNKTGSGHLLIRPIAKDPEGFVVESYRWNGTFYVGRKFPQTSNSSFIKILNVSDSQQYNIYLVSTLMNSSYLELQTPPQQNSLKKVKHFNSDIISLTFSNKNISIPENGIEVTLRHTSQTVGQKPMQFCRKNDCMYWNTTTLLWDTDGCKKDENRSNSTVTICICSHLTAFAILVDFHNCVVKDKGLEILTLILCPTSIICLIATVICVTKIKVASYERTTITQHFCVSLSLGHLLLLLFVDKDYLGLTDLVCKIVGIVTHYVFLCVLGWMAVHGHYLYRQLVLIFPGEDHVQRYKCFVYTFPLVLVGLTVAIGFGLLGHVPYEPYGNAEICWLNGHYIWTFMIPLAIVILGNVWMMVVVHKQVHRKRVACNLSSYSRNRKWLRGYFSLSVLLGLTWISGFFTLLDTPKFHFMAYVFTLLNASQGIFIFIFQCVLQEKVQQFFAIKYCKYFKRTTAKLSLRNKSPFSTRSISNEITNNFTTNVEISDEKDGRPENESIVSHFQEVDALLILDNCVNEKEKENSNEFSRKSVVNGNGTKSNIRMLRSKKFFVPWIQEMLESKLFLRHQSIPAHKGRGSFTEKWS